jgi:hypothetical protein
MFNWLKERFKDVFYDPTNGHLDSGRCMAYFSLAALIGAAIWNMHLHLEIKLSELGNGLGVLMTALVVYIYHDRKINGV